VQKCPDCGSKIKESTKFFECVDDEECGYRISKVKFQKQNQHWLQTTIEDENLWYKPIFDADIPIISAEYKRLYDLCENKQSFGMLLEIKDIFEILIKFPTLLTASAISLKSSYSDEESKLLIAMLERQLSLGTWVEKLAPNSNKLKFDDSISLWLTNITKVFASNSITRWRNEEIGHGALSLDETDKFQEDIKSKLSILKNFFEENIKNITMLKEPKYQELMESIYFEKDSNNNIHFFDSYGYGKTSRVDYRNGTYSKKIENQFTSLANGLSITQSTNRLDGCADSGVREAVVQKMFDELHKVDDYQTPTYLVKWLNDNMKQHKKGLFLLQMQRGMGKSMFSRALDELSLAKIYFPNEKNKNTLVRAYYINDVYSYKLDEFISVVDTQILNKQLLNHRIEDKVIGAATPKSLDRESQAKDFTNMLHQYKKVYGEENILFIIDGLDEIPETQEKTILDILPLDDDLPEGVFILFTSRVKLSQKVQTKLDSISFTDKKSVLKDDADYVANTNAYITKYMFDTQKPNDETLELIRKRSDGRYVYIKLIKELVKTIGLEIEEIPNADKIIELYLSNLKAKYGDKFFTNITNLLAVVSTQYEPLKLEEIAYMLQDECISFKLLAWINDTRGFFRFERSYRGNVISIEHADIKSYLTQEKSVLDSMDNILELLVENITNEEYSIDLEVDGESYLLSHIWDYPKKQETNDKLKNTVFTNSVFTSVTKIKGNDKLLLNRTIEIYSQLIEIMQSLDKDETIHFDKNDLALAFINRGVANRSLGKLSEALEDYNRAIEIMESLDKDETIHFDRNNLASAFINRGIANDSLGKLSKALEDYNRAIEIMESLDKDETIHFDRNDLASAFMNRGVASRSLGKLSEALEDYDRAIEIRESLDKDETIHFDRNALAIVFGNRGNANDSLGKLSEALEDYDRAIEIMESLDKDETIHFGRNDLAKAFMARGSTNDSLGKLSEALEDYNRAIEIMESLDKDETIHFDRNDLASVFMNRGVANRSLGKLSKALEDYNRAIEIMESLDKDETIHFDRNGLASVFFNRGIANDSLGKLSKALEDYNRAIEIMESLDKDETIHFDRNDLASVFMNRGIFYHTQDDTIKRDEDFNDFFNIIVELIYVYLESNNEEKATQIYQKYYKNIDMMLNGNMLSNEEDIQRYKALTEE